MSFVVLSVNGKDDIHLIIADAFKNPATDSDIP